MSDVNALAYCSPDKEISAIFAKCFQLQRTWDFVPLALIRGFVLDLTTPQTPIKGPKSGKPSYSSVQQRQDTTVTLYL